MSDIGILQMHLSAIELKQKRLIKEAKILRRKIKKRLKRDSITTLKGENND